MLKFNSKPISEHSEVPLADGGQLEELVEHWRAREAPKPNPDGQDTRVYIASVGAERDPRIREAQLAEMVSLVQSQGGQIVGREICNLRAPNARTLLGTGQAQAVADRAHACGATLLVLDAELSASQARNLEDAAGIAICDREAIILNVFLRHARTRQAKLQVEIAQLEYLRPRIRGVGLDMDQQTGGSNNARGPGETASELLARKLDGRLEELRKGLKRLEMAGRTRRGERARCLRLVLVGYTNAGKTSLMNALTGAALSARDRPFETLDTTSRCLTRHGGEVLISDTVGFIRRLPERLLISFESTLAEIRDATLLVVVVDASDYERALHLNTVNEQLAKIGAGNVPRFYVFNKLDQLSTLPSLQELGEWSSGHPWTMLSARDPGAVQQLSSSLIGAARRDEAELSAFVPYAALAVLGLIYARCRVVNSKASELGLTLELRGPSAILARIKQILSEAQ